MPVEPEPEGKSEPSPKTKSEPTGSRPKSGPETERRTEPTPEPRPEPSSETEPAPEEPEPETGLTPGEPSDPSTVDGQGWRMHGVQSDNNNVLITYKNNSVTFQDNIIAKTITCEWSIVIVTI